MNKVLIVKNYSKSNIDYYGEESFHNFHTLHEVKEVTDDQLETLRKAINYFNRKPNRRDYTVNIFSVLDNSEMDDMLLNFENYEETERLKRESDQLKKQQELEEKQAKAKEKALKTKIKSLSKQLGMTEDQVKEMLAKNQ